MRPERRDHMQQPDVQPPRARGAHYFVALGLVGAALLSHRVIAASIPGLLPYAPLEVAVILAAGLGGTGPGLVAVASSLVAAGGLVPRTMSASDATHWLVATGLFLVASGAILVVVRRMQATQRADVAAFRTLRRAADRRARETVDAANRELLAMLGHELRNPLSAMRTAVAVARMDAARRGTALDIARRQSDRLAHLVEGLLDAARITRGRIPLCRTRLRVDGVVDAALDAVHDLVEERHHVVTLHTPERPIEVEGDFVRLVQAVSNVIDNAARYTHAGGHIDVSAHRRAGLVEIAVRDDGPGVPQELAPRVFDLFAQGERPLDRRAGGLGVGLTVAKRIAELHGGSMVLRRHREATGSEFVLALPVLNDDHRTLDDAGRAAGRPVRVLLAEDDPTLVDELVTTLRELGHDVQVAHDGLAALGIVRERPPDLAILDLDLPGMDGREVARRIRECRGTEHTRLVALVDPADNGNGAHTEDTTGFERSLTKPLEPETLREAIAALR